MNPDVSIVPCANYGADTCLAALQAVLAPLGGLDWVKPGMRIGVKVNLVAAMKPDCAATTHPQLLCALTRLLRERGAQVILGDSPGGLYNAACVGHVYSTAGMHLPEQAGAQLNRNFEQRTADFPEAAVAKTFQYTAWLNDCDAIINFCKLKSHGMMAMSAAVKNLFGTIPGTLKPEYHFRYPDHMEFARMLVDLNEYWKPQLHLVDAVVGMEGNGPTAGTPRQIGALLAGTSGHKTDLVCAAVLGLRRQDVPTLEVAFERGLIPASADGLQISGSLSDLLVADFNHIDGKRDLLFRDGSQGLIKFIRGPLLQHAMASRPTLDASVCIGCGKCAQICPAKAIVLRRGLLRIDRSRCIRCFCCQEFCPKGALYVTRPPIARLLNR